MATTLPDPQFPVLITGGAGFIGSNLVDQIPPRLPVIIFDNLMRTWESIRNLNEIKRPFELIIGDVRDEALVKRVVREYHPGVIYHMAAYPSHRLVFTRPPLEYVRVNLLGTLNVLDAARETGSKVVFASSNKVYGHEEWGKAMSEDSPCNPEGPYALAKFASERYMAMYAQYYDVCSVALRFHHSVGMRCNSELALSIFTEAALKSDPLTVNGRSENGQWRYCHADFTAVEDIVAALLIYLGRDFEGFEIFNLGSGQANSVFRLAQLVLAETGSNSSIVQGQAMSHEGLWHLADASRAKRVLGWKATVDLGESVRRYVTWRSHRKQFCPGQEDWAESL